MAKIKNNLGGERGKNYIFQNSRKLALESLKKANQVFGLRKACSHRLVCYMPQNQGSQNS